MVNNQSIFDVMTPDKTPIRLANGLVIWSEGIGSIGNLHNVYYVPALSHNLLSVSYLNKLGFSVTFNADSSVVITDKTGHNQIIGARSNGLYKSTVNLFDIDIQSSTGEYVLSATTFISQNLLHRRLCHINDSYVNAAFNHQLICGMTLSKQYHSMLCESCILAKMTKHNVNQTIGSSKQRMRNPSFRSAANVTPLPIAHTNSSSILHKNTDLNHDVSLAHFVVDLKGPLPKSIHGNRYCMILTSSVNRLRKVYFLQTKDQTLKYFKEFLADMKHLQQQVQSIYQYQQASSSNDDTVFTKDTKRLLSDKNITFKVLPFSEIKSDNGREFVNKDNLELFQSNDIHHFKTSPYSPHQNGIAERSNRTVFELAAAMLHDSYLPVSFWEHAVKTVVHVLNLLPNKALNLEQSPFSSIFHRPADISHLRVFGADIYMLLQEHQRLSFGLRAVKGIFVGYCESSLSYLVYHNRKIYKSKDVSFNEDVSYRNKSISPLENELIHALNNPMPEHKTDDNSTSHDDISTHSGSDSDSDSDTAETAPTVDSSSILTPPVPTTSSHSMHRRSQTANFINPIPFSKYFLSEFDDNIKSAHFALNAGGSIEYDDAVTSTDAYKWSESMKLELDRLQEIHTFSTVNQLPPGRRPLKSKWVLKIKKDIFGKEIYKARLTVKGCAQKPGIDFTETFSPVAKLSSIRLILSLAAVHNLHLHQFDVQNAFPNAQLDEDIYMHPPVEMALPAGTILKLNRALYGLRQASRSWNKLLSSTLTNIGFRQLISDSCIYIKQENTGTTIVMIYVDDIIIAAPNEQTIANLHHQLNSKFKVNQTTLNRCLGFQLHQDRSQHSLSVNKDDYTKQLIGQHSKFIHQISFRKTPMDTNAHLSRDQCPSDDTAKQDMEHLPYRSIIGGLNYLAVTIRPDICFPVNYLSRFMDNPGIDHWNQLLNTLAYIRDHSKASIVYSNPEHMTYTHHGHTHHMQPNRLYCFVDADFASSDTDNRYSTTGYIILFNGGAISWKSQKQRRVAGSPTEAEYIALYEASKEVIWLKNILAELGFDTPNPAIIFEDNTSTIRAAYNPVEHSKLKHLDINYHAVREFVELNKVAIIPISTTNQIADMLTKSLLPAQFDRLKSPLFSIP